MNTETTYAKPLPVLDVWNRPFWEACKRGKLTMQRCAETGEFFYPPSPVSPATRKPDWTWEELSGRATVWSWVVMHQVYYEGFRGEVPYVIAQVKLEEGPMIVTNLVGVAPDAIIKDMAVEVVFEDATDEIAIPKFRPV